MMEIPVLSQELVQEALDGFAAAWNRGDLDAACEIYSKDASYINRAGHVHGKVLILAFYRKVFPNREAMGTMSFEMLEFRRVLSGTYAVSMGSALVRWTVRTREKATTGHSLVVCEYAAGELLLVQDATV